jgi:hypothetical protein
MKLSEDDLKEIFALFTSCTRHERDQLYREGNHYYKKENLFEEYELTQPKIEFARDAWRAVTHFLYRHGYELKQGNKVISLHFTENEFID